MWRASSSSESYTRMLKRMTLSQLPVKC
uniref:Uncharacterized protein n=1 Tax=Anguilla anguilla TaxID=7936 RepID=A0A0E9T634_ANGAN